MALGRADTREAVLGICKADGLDVEAVNPRLGDPDPVSVLVIVRPTLRYEFRGDAGSDLYGDALDSGGSPKMIS